MKKISVLIIAMMMFVGSIFAEDIVVFEPGVTPAKGGQLVEVDGETYFKIKCFGYDTSFKIPEVDLNGCTEFEASGYVEKENLKYSQSKMLHGAIFLIQQSRDLRLKSRL